MPSLAIQISVAAACAVVGIWALRSLPAWLMPEGAHRRTYVVAGIVIALWWASIAIPGVPLVAGIAMSVLLITLMFRPSVVVRLTGGPQVEWLLLRDRARLYFDIARSSEPLSSADSERFLRALEALDQYRTPSTAEYIELYQQQMRSERTDDEPARLARINELEDGLRRSLGAVPSWERDLRREGDQVNGQ